MTRCVVTGGAGFIGSHLVDALVERGDDVHVVDNLSSGDADRLSDGATLHVVDVGARELSELVSELEPATIFHLAAQADVRVSVVDPRGDATTNVLGTVAVVEAARAVGARVVFSSTGGAVYGECVTAAREDDPRRPLSPYGIAKLAAEEYLLGYNRLYGAEHSLLRYGNVFGPRQDPNGEAGVISIFLERLRLGRLLVVYGDGSQQRDFVFVGDVVAATIAASEAAAGVFNIGSGRTTSVLELARSCAAAAGAELRVGYAAARPGELRRSALDVSRAGSELGWEASVSLEEGLARTWDWLQVPA